MTGPRIVFMDSDAVSRKYVSSFLRQHGYEVMAAATAAEGLVAAHDWPPMAIVVDPGTLDLPAEELAARLQRDPALASVPLIALTSLDDPRQMRAWAKAGFSKRLVKSPAAMSELVGILSDLQGTTGSVAASGEPPGSLVVFLSAKGGTGTSTLCANLTMNMAVQQPDARFVVADLVLPVGSIAGIVGYAGQEDLVTFASRPLRELTPQFMRLNLPETGYWRFQLLAGSPDPEQANELNVGRIEEVISTLQSAFDFVVIDLGRALSRISLPLIQRADLIVMIVGTDMSTVSLSKTIWDYLQGKGVKASSVYAILNRAVGLQGLTKSEAEAIIGLPIRVAMPYLGENLTMADNQYTPYAVKYPGDTTSIILNVTAREMAGLASQRRDNA
jgi:Flp pilus assembly CpaE family ATPase